MAVTAVQFRNVAAKQNQKPPASAGNRTRVTRVAGEYSTTRPPMLIDILLKVVAEISLWWPPVQKYK